ncbi:MAG: hypothetical protein ACRDHF_10355, partial [Tepidiformaceae bacterium]
MISEQAAGHIDRDVHAGLDLAVRLLHAEIEALRAAGVPVGEDDYRGLYIPEREVDRLLQATPFPAGRGRPS